MNVLLQELVPASVSATAATLSAALVSESPEAHQMAEEFYRSIRRELGRKLKLSATWWQLSACLNAVTAKTAADAIANADLIAVTVTDPHEIEGRARNWIESWVIPSKQNPKLLALVHKAGVNPAGSQWELLLQSLAARQRMVYWAGAAKSLAQEQRAASRSNEQSSSPEIRSRFIEPYFHGGLNE